MAKIYFNTLRVITSLMIVFLAKSNQVIANVQIQISIEDGEYFILRPEQTNLFYVVNEKKLTYKRDNSTAFMSLKVNNDSIYLESLICFEDSIDWIFKGAMEDYIKSEKFVLWIGYGSLLRFKGYERDNRLFEYTCNLCFDKGKISQLDLKHNYSNDVAKYDRYSLVQVSEFLKDKVERVLLTNKIDINTDLKFVIVIDSTGRPIVISENSQLFMKSLNQLLLKIAFDQVHKESKPITERITFLYTPKNHKLEILSSEWE